MSAMAPGSVVTVRVDAPDVHLFDPETTVRYA
jgi:hypothetical protein